MDLEKLKNKVGENRFDEVISSLRTYLEKYPELGNSMDRSLIIIKGELRRLNEKKIQGISKEDDYERWQKDISRRLLSFIDEVKTQTDKKIESHVSVSRKSSSIKREDLLYKANYEIIEWLELQETWAEERIRVLSGPSGSGKTSLILQELKSFRAKDDYIILIDLKKEKIENIQKFTEIIDQKIEEVGDKYDTEAKKGNSIFILDHFDSFQAKINIPQKKIKDIFLERKSCGVNKIMWLIATRTNGDKFLTSHKTFKHISCEVDDVLVRKIKEKENIKLNSEKGACIDYMGEIFKWDNGRFHRCANQISSTNYNFSFLKNTADFSSYTGKAGEPKDKIFEAIEQNFLELITSCFIETEDPHERNFIQSLLIGLSLFETIDNEKTKGYLEKNGEKYGINYTTLESKITYYYGVEEGENSIRRNNKFCDAVLTSFLKKDKEDKKYVSSLLRDGELLDLVNSLKYNKLGESYLKAVVDGEFEGWIKFLEGKQDDNELFKIVEESRILKERLRNLKILNEYLFCLNDLYFYRRTFYTIDNLESPNNKGRILEGFPHLDKVTVKKIEQHFDLFVLKKELKKAAKKEIEYYLGNPEIKDPKIKADIQLKWRVEEGDYFRMMDNLEEAIKKFQGIKKEVIESASFSKEEKGRFLDLLGRTFVTHGSALDEESYIKEGISQLQESDDLGFTFSLISLAEAYTSLKDEEESSKYLQKFENKSQHTKWDLRVELIKLQNLLLANKKPEGQALEKVNDIFSKILEEKIEKRIKEKDKFFLYRTCASCVLNIRNREEDIFNDIKVNLEKLRGTNSKVKAEKDICEVVRQSLADLSDTDLDNDSKVIRALLCAQLLKEQREFDQAKKLLIDSQRKYKELIEKNMGLDHTITFQLGETYRLSANFLRKVDMKGEFNKALHCFKTIVDNKEDDSSTQTSARNTYINPAQFNIADIHISLAEIQSTEPIKNGVTNKNSEGPIERLEIAEKELKELEKKIEEKKPVEQEEIFFEFKVKTRLGETYRLLSIFYEKEGKSNNEKSDENKTKVEYYKSEAIKYLYTIPPENLYSNNPEFSWLTMSKAKVEQHWLKNFPEAIKLYKELLDPSIPLNNILEETIYFRLGECFQALNILDEAIQNYEESEKILQRKSPKNIDFLNQLVTNKIDLYAQKANFLKVIEEFGELEKLANLSKKQLIDKRSINNDLKKLGIVNSILSRKSFSKQPITSGLANLRKSVSQLNPDTNKGVFFEIFTREIIKKQKELFGIIPENEIKDSDNEPENYSTKFDPKAIGAELVKKYGKFFRKVSNQDKFGEEYFDFLFQKGEYHQAIGDNDKALVAYEMAQKLADDNAKKESSEGAKTPINMKEFKERPEILNRRVTRLRVIG